MASAKEILAATDSESTAKTERTGTPVLFLLGIFSALSAFSAVSLAIAWT
jgi:hypothetical protein